MTNFLKETQSAIEYSGHYPKDIVFIGSVESGHSCTWDEFMVLANFDYDSGFGGQEIATDVIIAFSDGKVMKRGEYDGSEWWEFSVPFVVPEKQVPIKKFNGGGVWASLEEMNRPGGKYGHD